MNPLKIILAALVVVVVFVGGFIALRKWIMIRYFGHEVEATIVKIPVECSKHNFIKVLFKREEQNVNISRKSCRDHAYKVGQTITLLKHEKYSELVWPQSNPELVILVFVILIILLYFNIKSRLKDKKGHTS